MNRFSLLRTCLQMIPARLQESVFQRWLRVLLPRCPGIYQNAPLNHAAAALMDLLPGDVAHGMIAAFGYYELPLTRMMKKLATTEGGVLLDVGANYGYFSLLWASLRADNSAEAIEASPRNLDVLTRNIDNNKLTDRIRIHAFTAGSLDGTVSFDLGPGEQTGWGGITRNDAPSVIIVPLRSLDSLFQDQSFTVLKVDCEGADSLVIEGAARLLDSHAIKHVFYEENIHRMSGLGISLGTTQRLLKEKGYRVEEFGPSEFHGWCE